MDIEYDEHIWTSPANAMKLVEVITEILKRGNPPEECPPILKKNKKQAMKKN